MSGSWHKIAPMSCKGPKLDERAAKATNPVRHARAAGEGEGSLIAGGNGRVHDVVESCSFIWCRKCGCYADSKARGLLSACKNAPPKHQKGGRWGQLNKLVAGSILVRPNRYRRLRNSMGPRLKTPGGTLSGARITNPGESMHRVTPLPVQIAYSYRMFLLFLCRLCLSRASQLACKWRRGSSELGPKRWCRSEGG